MKRTPRKNGNHRAADSTPVAEAEQISASPRSQKSEDIARRLDLFTVETPRRRVFQR